MRLGSFSAAFCWKGLGADKVLNPLLVGPVVRGPRRRKTDSLRRRRARRSAHVTYASNKYQREQKESKLRLPPRSIFHEY